MCVASFEVTLLISYRTRFLFHNNRIRRCWLCHLHQKQRKSWRIWRWRNAVRKQNYQRYFAWTDRFLFKPSSINRYSNGKCGNCKKDLYAFEKGYDVTVELLVRKNAIEEKQCIYRKACWEVTRNISWSSYRSRRLFIYSKYITRINWEEML